MKAYLLALGLIAQPAFAAQIGQAEFAPGTKLPAKLVVSDTIWTCANGRCTGPAETRSVAMQRACQTLAREIGAVAGFTVEATAFDSTALQVCNEKAGRTVRTVATR
jgi:hypothetical protein